MKFPYKKYPSTQVTKAFPEKSILLPIVPIRLSNNNKYVDCNALIDSGAGACLFPAEIGEYIGIQIVNEYEHKFFGIGGGGLTAYFHRIKIELGGHKCESYIGFTYDKLPFPLLGQNGFFSLFTVIFDLSKEIIELKRKTNGKP